MPGRILSLPRPEGVPMQFDYGRLTREGAAIVLRDLRAEGLMQGAD